MTGTILSTRFCSGGQRFAGATIHLGRWLELGSGGEVEGKIEEALKFQSMLEQRQRMESGS